MGRVKTFSFVEMGAFQQTLNTWLQSSWEDLLVTGALCPQVGPMTHPPSMRGIGNDCSREVAFGRESEALGSLEIFRWESRRM
jgi:hypothetical protein